MSIRTPPLLRTQAGAAAVEFALVAATILLPLLFAMMEFGRVGFYWNAATEATRLGARLAVVCNLDDASIRSRMTALFPVITTADIKVVYEPGGCTVNSCLQVTVSIAKPTEVQTYNPFFNFSSLFPPFSTTLPRESMRSAFGPAGAEVSNPVCSG
ncbi:hypothetical protein AB595_16200 [Massilia sp. WF1]|uniref:TadE/TadG family type IV pilus assembly protein n=1 Tax=unclassified Massilia TaxID=2609279 RepID=UPI0006496E0B|nr:MULTISPECIES: TadE family protein [unclassified Massilia]ALK97856.1 hypothetical protein AM586_18240 [Massilia sp. WG5]KLU35798.1 hypothetical protein AB595_16200 [Massilia sp. WF1]